MGGTKQLVAGLDYEWRVCSPALPTGDGQSLPAPFAFDFGSRLRASLVRRLRNRAVGFNKRSRIIARNRRSYAASQKRSCMLSRARDRASPEAVGES